MDREAFLSTVQSATRTASLPQSESFTGDLPELPHTDLAASFRANASNVNAVVHGPVFRHSVVTAVESIAAGHDVSSFMAWDDLPVSGVISALAAKGLERVEADTPREARLEHHRNYVNVELGITGADAGLAESGSLVLSHGEGRPRMVSLIPEIHIALLDVASIASGLAHWAVANPDAAAFTANLVFITGPSRTGDIEQQLNLGVHGPRHVHIVMIK